MKLTHHIIRRHWLLSGLLMVAVVAGLTGLSPAPVQAIGPSHNYSFSWDCGNCTTGHGSDTIYSGDCNGCKAANVDSTDSMDTSPSPVLSLGQSALPYLNDDGSIWLNGGQVIFDTGDTVENCPHSNLTYGSPGGGGSTTITVQFHVVDACGAGGGGGVFFTANRIGPPAWTSSSALAAPTTACATLQQEASLGLPTVTLNWSGAIAATSYQVYRTGGTAGTVIIAWPPAGTTTAMDASVLYPLQSNTTYSYFIRAWNSTSYTDSNTVTVKTLTCGVTDTTLAPTSATVPVGSTTPVPFTVNAKVDQTTLLP